MTRIAVLSPAFRHGLPLGSGNGYLDELVKEFDKEINSPHHFSEFRMPHRLRQTEFCLPESFDPYTAKDGRISKQFMFAYTNYHLKGNILALMVK